MTPEESEELQALERPSKRKWARKAIPAATPLASACNALDLPTIPSQAPALIGGDTIPLVAQAPASPIDDVGPPKEVIMDVVDVTAPSEETPIMEVVVPPQEAPMEITEVVDPSKGMIDTTSPLEEAGMDTIYPQEKTPMEAVTIFFHMPSLICHSQSLAQCRMALVWRQSCLVERQLLVGQSHSHMTCALRSFIRVRNSYISFLLFPVILCLIIISSKICVARVSLGLLHKFGYQCFGIGTYHGKRKDGSVRIHA